MLNEFASKPSHTFKSMTDEAMARRQVIAEYCNNLMHLLSPLSLKSQVCYSASQRVIKLLFSTIHSYLNTMIVCNSCSLNSQPPSKHTVQLLIIAPCPLLIQLLEGNVHMVCID